MLKPLLFALAMLMPATLQAQAWATRETCEVVSAEIDPQALPDALLAQLRADAAKIPNPKGRFWRVQSPGGAVSHLWGTVHSNDPLILDLPVIVQQRISGARIVALEFDPVFASRQAVEDHQEKELFRPKNSTYSFDDSGLDPLIVDWIRSRLDGLGWGREAADYLTLPFIVETLLSDPCDDFSAGVVPDQDSLIQTLGLIGGSRILGLESPDALTDHLKDPLNQDTTLALLAVYGGYLDPLAAANRATGFALYLQGELALGRAWQRSTLARIYGPDLAALYLQRADHFLLTQRNKTFLQTALPELQHGGVFMAIGSFHLPGEQGMIELLRQAGYTVSRIPLPGEVPDVPVGVTVK
ncbi:TraB/GumN family protein [Parasedimentitalea psychrophila]|uniref:TraB/GumN family protein n=1 Tax=Parasedimentitalea psychrophila TaxID=2997337 RepID=A0A9Y2L378_9RHOB|nr:TraB/GumN family protein [Parasedimentitalea psychrophila]WIY27189.1 TraB/GumN family protein [Parasedimentitalea psychrophila]